MGSHGGMVRHSKIGCNDQVCSTIGGGLVLAAPAQKREIIANLTIGRSDMPEWKADIAEECTRIIDQVCSTIGGGLVLAAPATKNVR